MLDRANLLNVSEDETAETRLDMLLALVTDPAACTKRLAELKEAQAALQSQIDKAVAAQQSAGADKADAKKTLAEAQQLRTDVDAITREYKLKNDTLAARIDTHEANKKVLLQRESDLKIWSAKVGEQDTTMGRREAEVTRREKAAKAAQDAADKMKADYEARIVKLVDHATGKA